MRSIWSRRLRLLEFLCPRIERQAIGMKLRNLFSRKPDAALSLAPEETKAKNPTADPLAQLTADMIETDMRREINRGLYARPAWTFHEMARIVSLLGDKVRFWRAQVVACEWKITIAQEAAEENPDATPETKARAKQQHDILKTRYEAFKNLKSALKHLATARFYGFAVVRLNGNVLQLVDPWNAIRDIDWLMHEPTFDWHFNREARTLLDLRTMPVMRPGEYLIRVFDDSCLIELLRLAYRAKEVMNFREKNLEEASKNQVIILTGAGLPEEGTPAGNALIASLKQARRGESAVIAKGDPNCPTEIHKLDAAKGLPFYNMTLDNIDQMMTKALTGGMLTMLSMPTGIGAGASPQHKDTLNALVAEDVGDISELLQNGIDRPTLEAAGLLAPGERALAWFELSMRKEADPEAALDQLVKAKQAGYSVNDAQASEITGLKLVKDAPVMEPQGRPLFNRESTAKTAALDSGFFSMIDTLAKEQGGDAKPTDEWFAQLEAAIKAAPTDAMMDTNAFEAYLRGKLAMARKQGLEDGSGFKKKDLTNRRD